MIATNLPSFLFIPRSVYLSGGDARTHTRTLRIYVRLYLVRYLIFP